MTDVGDAAPQRVSLIRTLATDRRLRYVATGGITAGVYFLIFSAGWLLLEGRVPYLVMAVIANFATALITYNLYRTAVFRSPGGASIRGFWKFYTVFAWGLAFSLGGLPLLVEVFGLNVLFSQAIILVATPLMNYWLHKSWTFRGHVTRRVVR